MKIVVLGDIHGRTIWKDIIEKEKGFDLVIFLGDYVTSHENISAEQQLSNLEEILSYKEKNSSKVVLLRGNHDVQMLGYSWAACSGYDKDVAKVMSESPLKERFLNNTCWLYHKTGLICSHAGLSKVWVDIVKKSVWYIDGVTDTSRILDCINGLPPSELFGFNGDYYDFTGESQTQPLTWIRPATLVECMFSNYVQVVGHTPLKNKVTSVYDGKLWLCDALENRSYLVIEDGHFESKQI